jgi:YHS domain-containing protein
MTRVEPDLVCMNNDQFMGQPQISVEVEGAAYYGCCDMCRTRLAADPARRSAIDPISGVTVDKAHAVIGTTEAGSVYYFENEQNLAAYIEPTR